MSVPSVGRIVHVRGRNMVGTPYGPCLAAIITEVRPDDIVRVTIFGHTELSASIMCCSGEFVGAGYYGYAWHWPERENDAA